MWPPSRHPVASGGSGESGVGKLNEGNEERTKDILTAAEQDSVLLTIKGRPNKRFS